MAFYVRAAKVTRSYSIQIFFIQISKGSGDTFESYRWHD
jgi:hypothetical protein